MKLPAYPLITVDPFFSIWSKSDKLYDGPTYFWSGIKKRITGTVYIDSIAFRFLGSGQSKVINQTDLEVTPYITKYTFENEYIRLKVSFWTPLVLNDLYVLSVPCSFIDYEVEVIDGKSHDIAIVFSAGEEFCYDKCIKRVIKTLGTAGKMAYGKIGRVSQKPLNKTGDGVSADWGYLYVCGGEITFGLTKKNAVKSVFKFPQLTGSVKARNIVAFDDILSIEYFGKRLTGLWKEKFSSIEEAVIYCDEHHGELLEAMNEQNKKILSDAEKFGEDYCKILTAAARQVLAAHKLVRNTNGDLLYLSKECHSNGCINTVDVSYPAVPMFLVYRPELVKAMMTGIFEFARMPVWQADFAPHDIGTYPVADGQVYALRNNYGKSINKRTIYKNKDFGIFNQDCQMPVEECGNMLIMSYAYYYVTGDVSQIKKNFDLLKKWADFLVKKGIILDNQLCTDDFAGHSEKNVNLAIKEIMGIACFSRICEVLSEDDNIFYFETAKKYAEDLCGISRVKDYLTFSIGKEESWSLKYNLVWDILFKFNIFDKEIYKGESEKYRDELNEYGVPLDYRKDFTKTDWMLWASCLDETGENIKTFSSSIVKYLADTQDKNCFTDWYETKTPKERGMNHRSVQAGLWMPVLKEKLSEVQEDERS